MEKKRQHLDEAQLAELRDDLGDAFDEFVGGFLETARGLPAALESELARGDLDAVAARAHRVKGTAGYLGAVSLVERLGRLQRAAQAGDADEARSLAQALGEDLAALAPRLAGFRSGSSGRG